jgi:hypothetical protein
LNKGDVVSIDIAIAGYTGDLQPELEGRLTGVKQFTPGYQWKQDRPPRMAWRAALAGVVLGAAAVLAGIIVNDVVHDDTPYSEVRLRDGTVICGSIKYLGEKRAAITSKSEGRLRVLPLQSIGKTKEDSC